jgi:hypothetical protein
VSGGDEIWPDYIGPYTIPNLASLLSKWVTFWFKEVRIIHKKKNKEDT